MSKVKLPLPKQSARAKPQYSPQGQTQLQLAFKNLPAMLLPLLRPQPQK